MSGDTRRPNKSHTTHYEGASQVGLRFRMRRAADQIREQHARLAPIFSSLRETLASGNLREAQTAAFRLQGALRAHFLLEEEIVFPALRGLTPDCASQLLQLMHDHETFDHELQKLVDCILARDVSRAAERLGTCVAFLIEHESREESLVSAAVASGD